MPKKIPKEDEVLIFKKSLADFLEPGANWGEQGIIAYGIVTAADSARNVSQQKPQSLDKAISNVTELLKEKAADLGANYIFNTTYQIDGNSVFAYGDAYKFPVK